MTMIRNAAPSTTTGRWLRPALLVVCLWALAYADTTPAQQVSGKRPLTHADYDNWRSIQGPVLSRDGKFLAYALVPQEGDGEIVVRNLTTGVEWRHTRGSFPGLPNVLPTSPARITALLEQVRGSRLAFTPDGRTVVFQIAPPKAETDQAKRAKKKPEEMPKNGLGIMDLATGVVSRIERVRSFQVPEEGPSYLAYHLDLKPEQLKDVLKSEAKTDDQRQRTPRTGAPPSSPGKAKTYGSDLVLRNLADKSERTFPDASEFSFSKDGKSLVYVVFSKKEENNGIFVVTPGTSGSPIPLLAGRGKYTKLTWDDKQNQLAFLSNHDDAAATPPKFKLYLWERKAPTVAGRKPGDVGVLLPGWSSFTGGLLVWALPTLQNVPLVRAVEVVSSAAPDFRPGMVISDKGGLNFSLDGSKIFFGVAPPDPEKDESKEPLPEEKVVVDLWHWKDDFIQPMQKVRAEQERERTFRAVYHLPEKKVRQLADQTMAEIFPTDDGRWALGSDDRPHRIMVGYGDNYTDYYLVNTSDGSRKPLLQKQHWPLTWSPRGKYLLFYDGKHWNSLAIADGKITNLTKNLGVNFWAEDYDSPGTPFAYGMAGWSADDQYALLYDRYDIWQVAAEGSSAKNLTDGLGRKGKIQFRYVRLDPQEKGIDLNRPLLLRAENEWTRDSGFYRIRNGSPPEMLLMAARNFTPPVKAKNADVLLLTASTFNEFPDLLVTNSEFKELKKVSNANPQKAQLLWGSAELVRCKNLDGVPLSGMLIKPENFDPNKKYPLMVYIYERLSQNLHHFVNPSPGTSINASYYASNGYLVFMPDIAYTIGYPGQSALKCVLPAIQAVVDKGFVDEKAIGIQGHSWGGYQIAYMITQTNRFKAVSAGAPVANMTSAYSGIRWGSGLPRQFQYELTQSRIGGNLWQYPRRFLENSPVFMADRVQTPLLMLHNDQDDAVPWYQGIEYFLALRRLGKEVYLFNYNGELHGLRKRVNQKDYTVRLQQFFDHYLKGAPKPAWMEKGIPYLQHEKEKENLQTALQGKS
jgi:dipeptidyl aminopeptidase/acylaminoacyl peptidase